MRDARGDDAYHLLNLGKVGRASSHKLLEPRTLAGLSETTTGVVKGCNLGRETAVSFSRAQSQAACRLASAVSY